MNDGRDLARAIDAFRRGWPVALDGIVFLAVENVDDAALARLDAAGRANLLISGNRAATLKLANQREGTPTGPVLVERASWIDLPTARAIADPALDLASPLKGPFRTLPVAAPAAADGALLLARLAGLLPALFLGARGEAAVSLDSAAVGRSTSEVQVDIAARAKLPVRGCDKAEIVAFRSASDSAEHVALRIGEPNGSAPLVRIHSECLTGDVLGSLKCDCGPQLDEALAAIAADGWGTLVYLRQEGRGIGLINKLRAYTLQDQGFDTVDANLRLGFGDDERSYAVAAAMLRGLGQERVRLLTNNPRKAAALTEAGIEVVEQVAIRIPANPHNAAYLDTKKRRSGHQL